MFYTLWRRWMRRLFGTAVKAARRRNPRAFRLALEAFEDRIVPSTVTVTDSSDNGSDTGSFRYILEHAVAGETIDFAPSVRTIDLTGSGLHIYKSVDIDNNQGAGPVTIDGDGFRVFSILTTPIAVSFTGLTIRGGGGSQGGGLYSSGGTVTFNDCTLTENSATEYGGAVYTTPFEGGGVVTFNNSTISDNSAGYQGGAIYNWGGEVYLNDSTMSGNEVNDPGSGNDNYGGGIFDNGAVSINNSTISDNSVNSVDSLGEGGAICIMYNPSIIIQNSTITGNTLYNTAGGTNNGGAICNLVGSPVLNGDIVAGNESVIGATTIASDIYTVSGTNLNAGSEDNLVGTGGSGGLTNGSNGNQVGVSLADVGLSSAGLANNGGPTETIALEAGSYAIGTGVTETNASTDQRGVGRPIGIPSDVGAFQLSSAPLVTSNPSNATLAPGVTTASFTAAASGYPTPTVQWQYSTNDGINFYNLSNGSNSNGGSYSDVTSGTLQISGISAGMSGFEYQAVFSNTPVGQSAPETAASTVATLIVDSVPAITEQPTSAAVNSGGNVTFTAEASGTPTPTVQWQVSTNGGGSFSPITNGGVYGGATTGTLTVTGAIAAMNGYEYEAVFTNIVIGSSNPNTATTVAAALSVASAPSIITDPSSQVVNAGQTATFTAAASGNPTPAVQWMVSTNGGTTYTNVSNGGVYAGAATGTLTVSSVTAAMNGYLYEAVFSNTLLGASNPSKATSTAASLTVGYAPAVISNPQPETIVAGGNATFTASAASNPSPAAVQWQVSTNGGGTFANITNGGVYGGATTGTLTITGVTAAMNGYEYQAVFTNTLFGASGPSNTITAAATLTIDFAAAVATDPIGETVDAGGTATFSASGSGLPAPGVQWEMSANDGATFAPVTDGGDYSGATSGTLIVNGVTAAMSGDEFEAVFSNTLIGASSPSTVTTTAAALTVNYTPIVAAQPSAAMIDLGGTTSFTASAVGAPTPTAQWEVSTDDGNTYNPITNGGVYNGATADTLTITGATLGMDGYLYEAVFTNTLAGATSPSSITTNPAALTIDYAPTVTTDPSAATATAGGGTSFTAAAADGYPVPTSVQWQVSTNGGTTFTNLVASSLYSGVTTSTLTLANVPASLDGNEYRAVFSNAAGLSADTTAASLSVDYAPTVTTDPGSQTATVGGTASFIAAASGDPAPTIQWQVSTDGGSTFNNIASGGIYSGVTSSTLTVAGATAAMNGYEYQAVFTNTLNGNPVSVDSAAATLTVDVAPAITTQPESQTVAAGSGVAFTASAGGNPAPAVQWQVSTNGGASFVNLANGGGYGGVNSGTLTIASATAAMNGYEYQAVFTNTIEGTPTSTDSATAMLAVDSAPTITTNPSPTTIVAGTTATFSAAASGFPVPAIQWQVSTDGGSTFNNIANGGDYSGATTGTLTVTTAASTMSGYLYQAVFTNTLAGSATPSTATTTAAELTVDFAATVTTQPGSQAINAGGSASFTAAASGNPSPAVQWQVSNNDGNTWSNVGNGGVYSGTTTDVLNITGASAGMTGYEYQAVFTNTLVGGTSAIATMTMPAMLSVDSAPEVTRNPTSSTIDLGSGATFTAAATGSPAPTAQWEVSTNEGASFAPIADGGIYSGATTPTLTITAVTAAMSGYEYQAVFTNNLVGETGTDTSSAATLSVLLPIDPATSTVAVSAPTVTAGNSVTVTLQAVNASGQAVTSGGAAVAFSLVGGGVGQGSFSTVIDHGNGTYTATFTGNTAGTASITATVGGAPIGTAPAAISVTPGPVDLEMSQCSAPAAMQLGGVVTVSLTAVDSFGNPISGLNVGFSLVNSAGGQGVFGPVIDEGNGTYTATFTGTVDGENAIQAAIAGVNVTSLPPDIDVTGAAVSLAKSVVTLSSGTVQSGNSIKVTFQAKAANGSLEASGGLQVGFALKSGSGAQGTFGPVTDTGNGSYWATFTGTLAGSNSIEAVIDGATATSKPAAVKVTAGSFSLATSTLTVSAPTVAINGKVTVTLQLRDAAGNKVTATKAMNVEFFLGSTSGGQGIFGVPKYNANGTCTVTFTANALGGNTIQAVVANNVLTGPAPVVTVVPPVTHANDRSGDDDSDTIEKPM